MATLNLQTAQNLTYNKLNKNQSFEGNTFTPNSIVLAKFSSNGASEYVEVSGIDANDPLTLCKNLIVIMLANYRAKAQFIADNKVIKDSAGNTINQNSGINPPIDLNKFLRSSTLWCTDAEGKISSGLELHSGLTLANTCAYIRKDSPLTNANSNTLRSIVHHYGKAILSQATYFDTLQAVYLATAKEIADAGTKAKAKKSA